jgi:hypothetical protein
MLFSFLVRWLFPDRTARVLSVFRHDEELSSGEIRRRLGWRVRSPYAELIRLERQGLITSRWVDGPYPRTRVYLRAAQKDHS